MAMRFLTVIVACTLCLGSYAQEAVADSVPQNRPGLFKRILNYFEEANDDHTDDKPFDVTFIGGPSYSSDMGAALGLMAAGLYKSCRGDSLTPVSNVTLFGVASTTGFYLVGLRGNHIGPQDRYRLNYKTSFSNFPTYFWGIGYENGRCDDDKTKYTLQTATIDADFQFRLPGDIYLGPSVLFMYSRASGRRQSPLWTGLGREDVSYGMGVSASYDTRDVITNAFRGVYVGLRQDFLPRFIGNKTPFSQTEITVSAYHPLWKGGVLAMMAHGMACYGDVPWQLLPNVSRSKALRAYYEGRYCDRNEMDFTVELRQHVWRRNGIVVWGGVGYVFPKFDQLTFRRSLPAFGIGYRWEFKKRVNVRLDYGIGRGSSQFVAGINEAF